LIWNATVENGFFADTDGSVWIGTREGSTHIQKPEALMQSTPIDLRITWSALAAQGLDAESLRRPWEPNMALDLHLAQLNVLVPPGRCSGGHRHAHRRMELAHAQT
jgi:hypothetical protein